MMEMTSSWGRKALVLLPAAFFVSFPELLWLILWLYMHLDMVDLILEVRAVHFVLLAENGEAQNGAPREREGSSRGGWEIVACIARDIDHTTTLQRHQYVART